MATATEPVLGGAPGESTQPRQQGTVDPALKGAATTTAMRRSGRTWLTVCTQIGTMISLAARSLGAQVIVSQVIVSRVAFVGQLGLFAVNPGDFAVNPGDADLAQVVEKLQPEPEPSSRGGLTMTRLSRY
jgi:hypothetical protein